MKCLTLAVALLVTFGSTFTLFAGAPYQALDAGDVFVATITRMEDKDATNARPPRVWINVHEVIRGDANAVRSPALWSPPFHGIDWGDGNQPELKRWYAAPLKGPKVGQKFILGGTALKPAADEKDAPVYYLFDFVRTAYSDEARAKAIATLAFLDAERRKYAADQAAAAHERELRGQKWRAALTGEVIDKRTREADAVAIGQINHPGFQRHNLSLITSRYWQDISLYSLLYDAKKKTIPQPIRGYSHDSTQEGSEEKHQLKATAATPFRPFCVVIVSNSTRLPTVRKPS